MYGSIRRREIPVAWVGRVAGVSPQLQGLPAVRVQVFAMPATAQQEDLSLSRLHETCDMKQHVTCDMNGILASSAMMSLHAQCGC